MYSALSTLQDAVAPESFAAILSTLYAELSDAALARIATIDPVPLAAGSVAQVHRATLVDGREIVLKVQRPGSRLEIELDELLIALWARTTQWLVPSLRPLDLVGVVDEFGVMLRSQLDFRSEAEHNRRFARNFARLPGARVPRLEDDMVTERVLGMEYIRGTKATEAYRVGAHAGALARRTVCAVLQMVFDDGFVHADLHAGNILLTREGDIVFIDTGMVSEVPRGKARLLLETFICLFRRDGRRAAELFYTLAPSVGRTNYAAFEADMAHFVGEHITWMAGFDELHIVNMFAELALVLRKHQINIDSALAAVNLALMSAQGVAMQLDPTMNIVLEAMPYMVKLQFHLPPLPPRVREIPVPPPRGDRAVRRS
jgi:ubiquinone biosynthesis protein